MQIDILSLFPSYFDSPFSVSIVKRAQEKGLISIHYHNIRDFSDNRHNKVDDRPYGGGPGMVLMPGPVARAIKSCSSDVSHVVYLSPQGKKFTAEKAQELSQKKHIIFLCGHYEGVDERIVTDYVHEEISIGDYILTNGCLAACVVIDALVRFIPGVLGDEKSSGSDSFENTIFDYPQYTQPVDFNGLHVPSILLSGDHKKIDEWRKKKALEKTLKIRPELALTLLREQPVSTSTTQIQQVITTCSSLNEAYSFYKKIFGSAVCSFNTTHSAVHVSFSNCMLIFIEGATSSLSLNVQCTEDIFQKIRKNVTKNLSKNLYSKSEYGLVIQDPFGITLFCLT